MLDRSLPPENSASAEAWPKSAWQPGDPFLGPLEDVLLGAGLFATTNLKPQRCRCALAGPPAA